MTIKIIQQDITTLAVDVIVNAANSALLGGGGVDGAIHAAAGPELLAACRQLQGCQVGMAKITPGFHLPAKWVIHAVGPIWQDGNHHESVLLKNCYTHAFELAKKHQLRTIAFPAISTGIYHFPKKEAAIIALTTMNQYQQDFDNIVACLFSLEDKKLYEELRDKMS